MRVGGGAQIAWPAALSSVRVCLCLSQGPTALVGSRPSRRHAFGWAQLLRRENPFILKDLRVIGQATADPSYVACASPIHVASPHGVGDHRPDSRLDVEVDAIRRLGHWGSRGYSSDRTSLRPWRLFILALACTTRGQPVSSGRGSAPMRTAWTIWTGCAGPAGSCVRGVATPAGGPWPTADTDARRVVAGPRSRPERCSTAAGRR